MSDVNYGQAAKHVKQLEGAFRGLFEVAEIIKKVGDLDKTAQEKHALAIEEGNKLAAVQGKVSEAEDQLAKARAAAAAAYDEAEALKQEAAQKVSAAERFYADTKAAAEKKVAEAEKQAQVLFDVKTTELDAELEEARTERDELQAEIAALSKSIGDLQAEFEALKARFQ